MSTSAREGINAKTTRTRLTFHPQSTIIPTGIPTDGARLDCAKGSGVQSRDGTSRIHAHFVITRCRPRHWHFGCPCVVRMAHNQRSSPGRASGRNTWRPARVATAFTSVRDGVLGGSVSSPEDLYEVYARLRTEDPIHRTREGLWILTRHADVAAILRDSWFGREGFERHFTPIDGGSGNAGGHRQSMLFRDPPHHTRLRDAVSRAFEALRPRVQAHVDALLDRVASAGRTSSSAWPCSGRSTRSASHARSTC
jgi:hypothetical protein